MSDQSTDIDYRVEKELCKKVLATLAKDNKIVLHTLWELTQNSPLIGIFTEEEKNYWDDGGRYCVSIVLKYKGLLVNDSNSANKTYDFFITEEGEEFINKSDVEINEELDTMWKNYDTKKKEFFAPITKEHYIQAISKWINNYEGSDNNQKRLQRNAQYFLAKLLKGDSIKEISEPFTNAIHNSIRVHFASVIRKYFSRPTDYSFPKHELFMNGDSLKEEFVAALKELDKNKTIILAKWESIIPEEKDSSGKSPEKTEETENEEQSNIFETQIDEILKDKYQVIFYGPPGTGKTYAANKYLKDIDDKYVRRCTFHPEYGYEHFIEGYRPTLANGQIVFERVDGVFKELCDKAKNDKGASYYLLIDEINRGDIPRIFGELITLIEKDKRKEENSVILSLSKESFYVPSNVYILATMNTADRSIALLDSALRRRFGFIEMKPEYHHFERDLNGKLKQEDGTPCNLAVWFEELNNKLSKMLANHRHDVNDILIGHSYFIIENEEDKERVSIEERFPRIIRNEIYPLLKEYCYDDKKTYEALKDYILKTTGITPEEGILKNTPIEYSDKPQIDADNIDTNKGIQE